MPARPTSFYGDAVAHIHDRGHTDFVRCAAPAVLRILRRHGVEDGRVLDLGCGAGQLSRALATGGLTPWGLDVSAAMVRRARHGLPGGTFVQGDLETIPLPACRGAVAVGEVLNYLSGAPALRRTLKRIFAALNPGGLFVFDLAVTDGRSGSRSRNLARREDDWALLGQVTEDLPRRRIARDITAFVRRDGRWRRSDEMHVQRLYASSNVAAWLRRIGFRVRIRRAYGAFTLPADHRVFLARKP